MVGTELQDLVDRVCREAERPYLRSEFARLLDALQTDAYQLGMRDGMRESDTLPSNVSPHSFGDGMGGELPIPPDIRKFGKPPPVAKSRRKSGHLEADTV